ncbi:substrate-binding domain-containing protein, partial [Verrucomicrobia bacterium]|nr:substrate-binding domain-containing protein [Verrucomicrobiota bacterium]
ALKENGLSCHQFPSAKNDNRDWTKEGKKIAAWLKKLPRPIGIMACYDIRGQQLLDVCRDQSISVPDEVAVIGQHNDELLCELCDPPLSSVIPDPRRAGHTAASLLDRMMRGQKADTKPYLIAPLGVATRRSTDVVSIPDSQLSKAIRYIRDHALEGINVADVLKAVPMSRTLLERRFKHYLKRSPYDEILNIRLRKAKELLKGTELPIAEVSARTGFTTPEYLSAAFKKKTGFSPRAFRSKTM